MPPADGMHSTRRTKVSSIYPCTKNLHAVQLLLLHTKHQPEANDMHSPPLLPTVDSRPIRARDQSKLTISTQLAPFPVGYLLSNLSAPLF